MAPLRGWLLLLSRLLIVYLPLNLAVAAMSGFNAVSVRGPVVLVILAVRGVVTAVGVAAGLALSNRQANGVALAKVALILSAGIDLFVYTTPYFPNNRMPGDTIYYVAGSLVFHAAWLVYLFRHDDP
jgi:hypothetical protein